MGNWFLTLNFCLQSLLVHTVLANQGVEDPCAKDKKQDASVQNAINPCHEADIAKTGAISQTAAAAAFAAAMGVCLKACGVQKASIKADEVLQQALQSAERATQTSIANLKTAQEAFQTAAVSFKPFLGTMQAYTGLAKAVQGTATANCSAVAVEVPRTAVLALEKSIEVQTTAAEMQAQFTALQTSFANYSIASEMNTNQLVSVNKIGQQALTACEPLYANLNNGSQKQTADMLQKQLPSFENLKNQMRVLDQTYQRLNALPPQSVALSQDASIKAAAFSAAVCTPPGPQTAACCALSQAHNVNAQALSANTTAMNSAYQAFAQNYPKLKTSFETYAQAVEEYKKSAEGLKTATQLALQGKEAQETYKKACDGLGYTAMATDLAGAIATAAQAKNYMNLGISLATSAAQTGANIGMANQSRCHNSCPMVWIGHAGQSLIRAGNAGISWKKFADAQSQKQDMTMTNRSQQLLAQTAAGGSSEISKQANGISIQKAPTKSSSPENASPAKFKEQIAASAASAAFAPTFDVFEKTTGQSRQDLIDRIAEGQTPMLAAAEMSGALDAESATLLKELDQHKVELAETLKSKITDLPKNASIAFEGSGGSGSKFASSDLNFPDLSSLMASLNPQQPAAENGGRGVSALKSLEPSTPPTLKEGFHTAEKSIFEIVGSRYQKVSSDFLSGRFQLKEEPASLIPVNPYLKK